MYWRVMSRMRAVLRWQYVLESDVQNEGSDAPYPSIYCLPKTQGNREERV